MLAETVVKQFAETVSFGGLGVFFW